MNGSKQTSGLTLLLNVVLTIGVLVVDWQMRRGWAVWGLYALPMFGTYWIPRLKASLYWAALCSVLTILGYFISVWGIAPPVVLYARGTGIALFWVIGFFIVYCKRAEEGLREKEYLLSQSQRIGLIGGWSFEPATGCMTWTEQTYQLYGVSPKTFVPSVAAILGLVHPDDRGAVQEQIRAFATGEPPGSQEFRVPLPDGQVRTLSGQGEMIPGDGCRPERIVGTVQDVTERKQAEAALSRSEQRFRSLVECAPMGVWQVGPDGNTIQYFNPAMRRILEIPPDEKMSGKLIKDFIAPESRDLSRGQLELRKRGLSSSYEINSLSRTNRRIPALVSGSPIVDPDGRLTAIVGMTMDITDRKRAEEMIREQARVLDLIFEHSLDCIVLLDKDYNFIRVNRAYADVCRRDASEFVGRNHFELYPSPLKDEFDEAIRQRNVYRRTDRPFTFPDHPEWGVTFWDLGMVPIRNRDDEIELILFTLRDVTERNRAEEQARELRDELAHANRLGTLGEIASGLAHELNQPLTAIHLDASTALLLSEKLDAPDLQDCLRYIGEQSFRAGEIIRRMRSFIRRGSSSKTLFDLNSLVHEVLLLLADHLRQNAVQVDLILAERLPPVAVDAIQIQQVLVNLICNAVDAMVQNGDAVRVVSLRTETIGDEVRVSIADTGCGLEPDMAAELFFPFKTTKATGLGLGLAICRTLVEAHGGNITACANSDRGMTFTFTLPTAP